jgi:hypothetical protein
MWSLSRLPLSLHDTRRIGRPVCRGALAGTALLWAGAAAAQDAAGTTGRNQLQSRPVATSPASRPSPPMGEVRIEGQFVTELVLIRLRADGSMGEQMQLAAAASVRLPAGEYFLRSVRLGKYHKSRSPGAIGGGDMRISVSPAKPATLKVGGPLRHKLEVEQSGNSLELTYHLLGVGGEEYLYINDRDDTAPRFAVCKGDKVIATGQFEFG